MNHLLNPRLGTSPDTSGDLSMPRQERFHAAPTTPSLREFSTMSKMTHQIDSLSRFRSRRLLLPVLALALSAIAAPLSGSLAAQTITANLSGYVNDPDGAVIPGAEVTLINESSKDKRVTKSNSAGYFTFSSVPTGTYEVDVQHQGFASFSERGIQLHPADDLALTNVKLAIGEVNTVVTVNAASAGILNQGEKSTLITADDIAHLPVEGRDVTELIKTLPGFALTNQSANSVAGTPENQGPNLQTVGGQTQNYTANGVTPEGVQIISDGVNISDPGNGSGTDQVINMDNVAEVKIQMSNFGADSAKGPIVINAVGKSGGSDYHGSLYVYGRTYQLDTQDWFSKYDGDAKPQDREIYPGANFGGPVKIPGTNFNHSKRWTFFAGAEDYVQRNVYAYGSAQSATIDALVPTCAMRGLVPSGSYNAPCSPIAPGATPPYAADFSEAALTQYFGVDPTINNNCSATGVLALYINICKIPSGQYPYASGTSLTPAGTGGAGISNGQLANGQIDPNTYALVNALMPLPNETSFNHAGGGTSSTTGEALASIFNYRAINFENQDSYQARLRTDYAFSDNDKIFFVYNFQHTYSLVPQSTYYSPQDAFGEVNTPGGVTGNGFDELASVNYTKVFAPSLTNEFYAGANYSHGGNAAGNLKANLKTTIGYNLPGIYPTAQVPQFDDYGFNGLPLGIFPDFSSPIFQHKFVPNGGDNLTKVIRTHTLKFGSYIERAKINETDLNIVSQGQIQNYYVGPNTGPGTLAEPGPKGNSLNTQGNYLASFMLGLADAFNQYNIQTNSNLYYWTVDTYATDNWKVTKKLTLDIGGRLGHVGPWQDQHGQGMAVWNPKLYNTQTSQTIEQIESYTGISAVETTVNVPGLATPGFTWHSVNKTVPNSGAGSVFAFFSPRFGMAYDMYGNGKTFFRGGIGAYRSHDSWNDVQQANGTSQGVVQSFVGGGGIGLRDIPTLTSGTGLANPTGSNGCGCDNTAFGLQQGDTEQPLTWTYSFTASQQLNSNTLFELSYQGSQSRHLLTQWESGAPGDLENINAIPVGTLFKPDPYTGAVEAPEAISNADAIGDYRQFPYYSQVNVIRHALYANYNALQASIKRTAGRFLYSVNYTWAKDLGVFGSYNTGNVIDSTNIRPNYGPLLGDRSDVVNATFSFDSGRFNHGNHFTRGALSSYTLSGILNLQSGADVQRILTSNFNLQGNITNPAGTTATNYNDYPISNTTFIGTPDVVLQPALLCDPRTAINRSQHQYLNGNCFTLPSYGVNGPAEIPYIHAPAYFDFDARLSKAFKVGEKKDIQMQLSAFNVINRANYSFSSKFPTEQTLYYNGTSAASATKPSDFGFADFRFGRRVAEISLKYNF
jgi:hypothetical protein